MWRETHLVVTPSSSEHLTEKTEGSEKRDPLYREKRHAKREESYFSPTVPGIRTTLASLEHKRTQRNAYISPTSVYTAKDLYDNQGNMNPQVVAWIYQWLQEACLDPEHKIHHTRQDVCDQEFPDSTPETQDSGDFEEIEPESQKSRPKRFIGAIIGMLAVAAGAIAGMVFTGKAIGEMKKKISQVEGEVDQNREDIFRNHQMINLTKIELGEHRKLLHKLDKLTISLNHTLNQLKDHVDINHKLTTQLMTIKRRIQIMRSGKDALRHDLALLFKYLDAVALQQVSPTLITPVDLRFILMRAQEERRGHPRLGLPEDPEKKLWSYYTYLKIVPVVLDHYLVVSLQIPLVDASTTFSVYEAHNLPALHPKLKVNFQYELEGNYLAVSNDLEFFMLPTDTDVLTCQLTRGHWCKLRTAMYPVKHVTWCIASLFQNNKEQIEENC